VCVANIYIDSLSFGLSAVFMASDLKALNQKGYIDVLLPARTSSPVDIVILPALRSFQRRPKLICSFPSHEFFTHIISRKRTLWVSKSHKIDNRAIAFAMPSSREGATDSTWPVIGVFILVLPSRYSMA
jgi:hypothetical protein